jgi:PPM family protein phosphatase
MQVQRAASGGSMHVSAAALSHRGRLRATNEDSYLLRPPMLAVADGLGGLAGGEVASRLVVDFLAEHGAPLGSVSLADLLQSAGRCVRNAAAADDALAGMATTCTLAVIADERAQIAHVGDSRAYALRTGELRQLTRDHSVAEELVRLGRLTEDEALTHPARHTLTRALGGPDEPQVDELSWPLRRDDRLLLCSDGLTGLVDDRELRKLLDGGTTADAARRLVEAALDAGGADNVTVIVVDVA